MADTNVSAMSANNYFPHAKGDLSPFDVDSGFVGYNTSTKAWLASLNPATGNTDEDNARLLTTAAYAHSFDETDENMANGVRDLLVAVAGNATTIADNHTAIIDSVRISWMEMHSLLQTPCAV